MGRTVPPSEKIEEQSNRLLADQGGGRSRSSPSCFACNTKALRTEPLRAMVIGAFARGLSMRDKTKLAGWLLRQGRRRPLGEATQAELVGGDLCLVDKPAAFGRGL